MTERLEYELTNDDYLAFNRHLARTSPTVLAQVERARRVVVASAVGIGLAVLWLATRELILSVVATAIATAVMWLTWTALHHRNMDAQLRRMARKGDLGRLGPTVLTWDDRRITESATASQAIVGWQRVQRVEETEQHLFLMLGDLEALVVPKRAGAGVAELAVFARTKLAIG